LDGEPADLRRPFRLQKAEEIARNGDVGLERAATKLGLGKEGLEVPGEIREAERERAGVRDAAVLESGVPFQAMRTDPRLPAQRLAVEGGGKPPLADHGLARLRVGEGGLRLDNGMAGNAADP